MSNKIARPKTRLSCNFILLFLVFILNKKEKNDIIVTRIFHKSKIKNRIYDVKKI